MDEQVLTNVYFGIGTRFYVKALLKAKLKKSDDQTNIDKY